MFVVHAYPNHVPSALALDLLTRIGATPEVVWYATPEDQNAFKVAHNVEDGPLVYHNGKLIGDHMALEGYVDLFDGVLPILRITKLRAHVPAPSYGSDAAAGIDLSAASPYAIQIAPQGRTLVPTGIAVAIPPGYFGDIRGRSGLAMRHGIAILGGIIDSDYRGEIGVVLANTGAVPFLVEPGARIAQMIIQRIARPLPIIVNNLDATQRGEGGFGSTDLPGEIALSPLRLVTG